MRDKVETRPSGASRWVKCSAAPLFAAKAGPQPSNDAADEGTCAAWVGDTVLKGQALQAVDLLGERHANGWEVDAEMCGHIQNYVDMVRADGGFVSTERFVRLSDKVAGTLDNSASFLNGVVKVRDLKYGFRLIEASAEQLVIYAGALAAELINGGTPVREIHTEIYQPRGFHHDGIHRKKVWTPDEIFARCQWIIERAEECHKPNPVATPGPHCLDCAGATGCAALAATTANLLAYVNDDRHREMTPAELADRLTFLKHAKKTIDAAASAVEAEALARTQAGERLPGYGMKERLGNGKLVHSREAIKALTGIDPVKQVMMSPAEFKAAGGTAKQLAVVSRRPSIGHKLAPLDPNDLKQQFKGK